MKYRVLSVLFLMVITFTADAAELGRWTPTKNDVKTGSTAGIGVVGFQVGIWDPIQFFSSDYDVYGFRLDLPYGRNKNMSGLDLGVFNYSINETRGIQIGAAGSRGGSLVGVQIGMIWNQVDTEMVGMQGGLVNRFGSTGNGFQLGGFNVCGEDYGGVQFGVVNMGGNVYGFQCGLVNSCGTLNGIQLGLFNFILKGNYLNFCPIVNASF